MQIQYEDTMTCVQCWGGRDGQESFKYQNQIYCIEQQQYASNKSSKTSLKKLKILQKPHQTASSRISQSQTHQRFCPITPLPQPQYFLQRPISQMVQERPKSQISQNSDIKVTFNRESCKENLNFKGVTTNQRVHLQKKEEIALDQTAKICKEYQNNRSQLFQTKKIIPGSRFSLEELSQMRQSVYSVIQGEDKTKIEQSMIMMDFFNPSNSRLADFKLKSKLQHASSACSQIK